MILRTIAPLLCLTLSACGAGDRPADHGAAAPQETVFDDVVDAKRAIPAAVEDAQQEHADQARRALDAAEGSVPGEAPAR